MPDQFIDQKQVHVPTSDLHRLAEDHLQFTRNFFLLIRQSAPHIYHSALPLSPSSSAPHSTIIPEKSLLTGFYGRPETWGAVIQTIQSPSTKFTDMAAFGCWIAAACSDGVVRIYDAVSGGLKQSLRPADPVKAVRGLPDGSALFCTHHGNSVTLWDLQTGGLTRTFTFEEGVRNIAVSLKGRYVAFGFSNELVRLREVAKEVEGAIRGASPVTCFCWLEPEERLVIAEGESARIYDVVAGITVRSFTMACPIYAMVYSQKLDRLAVGTGLDLIFWGTIEIIDLQAGTTSTLSGIRECLPCFAFSQTTEELWCGMKFGGPRVFNFSTQKWTYLTNSDTMEFISPLQNGTLAVGSSLYGIQVLSRDDGGALSLRLSGVPAMRLFDQRRLINITSIDIQLLETSTMSNLSTLDLKYSVDNPMDRPPILSASLENRVVVYCFQEGNNAHLALVKFGDKLPKWVVEIGRLPRAGEISPSGTRVVTIHEVEQGATRISVWDARDGRLQAKLLIDHPSSSLPLITFDSETRFYSYAISHCIPYDLDVSSGAKTTHTITRREQQPWPELPGEGQYELDSRCEWVVSGSKRVCWIPPEYVRGWHGDYAWADSDELFLVGQDRRLRKLSFRS